MSRMFLQHLFHPVWLKSSGEPPPRPYARHRLGPSGRCSGHEPGASWSAQQVDHARWARLETLRRPSICTAAVECLQSPLSADYGLHSCTPATCTVDVTFTHVHRCSERIRGKCAGAS